MSDAAAPNKAPFVIIKHREAGGTIDRSVRICMYWKCRKTGTTVEVRRFLKVADDPHFRVVFFDPMVGRELSMPWQPGHPLPFQPPGAKQIVMEDAFVDNYEPVGNFSSKF